MGVLDASLHYSRIYSEGVASHTHVDHHTQGEHHGSQGRAAITYHGKRHSHHGHDPRHHGNINDHVPKEDCHHSEHQQAAETVLRSFDQSERIDKQRKVKHQ